MVPRPGTNARRTGTGGHRVFAGNPGTHPVPAATPARDRQLLRGRQAGQAYAAANGYVPLPAQMQQLARTTLQRITGPSGTSLLS
jgi:hypothetical protein